MKSEKEIREDLKNIKYYYSRKEIFDDVSISIGNNAVLEIIEKYNKIICVATPRQYDIYVSLYMQNNTEESLAEKLGYSVEHISRLNSKLVKFFKQQFENKEVK